MTAEAPRIYPSLRYRDAATAVTFLKAAFDLREVVVHPNPDGTIAHAELSYGPSVVMLGSDKDDQYGERSGQGWLYVAVDDADAHYTRARAAGADILTELHDTDYGSRDYAARDLEGNIWNFGTYRPAAIAPETATAGSAAD
jgi:uncharacterized glyoxalase superfamily protein PhnB